MTPRIISVWRARPRWGWRLLIAVLVLLVIAVLVAVLLPLPTPWTGAQPAADAAYAPLRTAIARAPQSLDGYRALSLAYTAAGRWDAAAAVWEEAIAANPGQTWPLLERGRSLEAAGRHLEARAAYYQAAELNPQDTAANQALARLAAQTANEQAIKTFLAAHLPDDDPQAQLALLPQPLPNGWTFLGVHGDLAPLAAGRPAPLWVFYQAPASDLAPAADATAGGKPVTWEPVAPGLWAAQVTATNLIANGNFEGALDGTGPAGFGGDLLNADPMTRQVRRLLRDDQFTTVALLDNTVQSSDSSFATAMLPLPAASVLLAAADVDNQAGNPVLAWAWSGGDNAAWPLPRRAPAPARQDAAGWQTHRGLAVPLPGATGVQVQLLNLDSSGAAAFDNVVLAPLPLPAPLWPVIAPAEGETALSATSRLAQFQAQIERYLAYPPLVTDPAWLAELGKLGPVVSVNQTLTNGWTLLGYSADEARLARGESAPLALYWRGPAGAIPGPAQDGWHALDNGRWLQFLPAAANSLANGSFETGLGAWPAAVFPAPANTRQLAVAARAGITSTVAVLANTGVFTSTSLLPAAQAVAPGQIFLQSGWLRSDDAFGWIGYQWAGEIDASHQPPNRYIVAAQGESDWTHYAGVAEPPPGSTAVQVHLLNYPSSGVAYFDDILFIPIAAPIPAPGYTQPQGGAGGLLAEYAADPMLVGNERWLTAVAATGPARLLDQGLDTGWSLLGYTADEAALAAGAVAPVFFYWQGPLGATPGAPQEGWYSIDAGLWLHVKRVANLLPGNLRLALPDAPAAAPVAVDERLLYLLAVEVRSLNAAAVQAGVAWQGAGFGEAAVTQMIARNLTASEWTPAAGLLLPPAGATAAQVQLAGDAAQAEAAGLLLLPVTPPAPLPEAAPEDAPAVGAAPAGQAAVVGVVGWAAPGAQQRAMQFRFEQN